MRPVVVVIENPNDDPDVLYSGDVDVVELSSYPASSWCTDDEVLSYGVDYLERVKAARDLFPEGSLNWSSLNWLADRFADRLTELSDDAA